MAKHDPYFTELHKIMSDKSPVPPSTTTRAELEAMIAEISAMLTKPMHNAERLCLVEDRQNLRKALAQLS